MTLRLAFLPLLTIATVLFLVACFVDRRFEVPAIVFGVAFVVTLVVVAIQS